MRNGIYCAGNLVLDKVKIIEQYPEEGMLANIVTEKKYGGGAVINVLCNLALLDNTLPLYASGIIGNDDDADFLIQHLEKYAINIDGIKKNENSTTSYTDVFLNSKTGHRTFFHQKGSNSLLSKNDILSVENSASIFHLGYLLLLDKLDEVDNKYGTVAASMFHQMQKIGYKTSADIVSNRTVESQNIIIASLKYLNYLIINEIEAEIATDISCRINGKIDLNSLRKAASKLLKFGVNDLVVIHFPEGGYAKSHSEESFVPSVFLTPEQIKSNVGAGDAFCAVMLYSLHKNFNLEKSLKLANRFAALNLKSQSSTGGAVSINNLKSLI